MSKLFVLTAAFMLSVAAIVSADEADSSFTGWKKSLVVDVTATQTAYSDSWVGGELGAASWVGNLNGTAEKLMAIWFDFKSTLKLSYGQTITQDSTKTWSKPRKSTDLIDFENVGRFTLHKFVDPYVALRIESQFLDASVPAVDRYFSPFMITESAGISRKLYEKEKNLVFSRLGFATRQIFKQVVTDSLTLATVDSTLTDGGIESVTDAKFVFNEKLNYTSKLTLYKAFFSSVKDKVIGTEAADYWKMIDVNWENIVNASLTKIITVNFYTQLLYDKEISKKGRLKQTLGIGFIFKLI